ncbi:MAG: enoyl-CoA hydratase [Acidimicrobiales bacterium]|nr:MAG: enoyl-CoA hydratase [Acidimicrobiales bacterium]
MTENPHPNVKVAIEDGIGTITVDRPERMNACTGAMFDALHRAAIIMRNASPRVVIFRGGGDHFCSGADVSGESADGIEGVDHGLHSMRRIGDAVIALHELPMPTIAAVDGVCVGAGFGLALSADLLVCTDRARFALIFARRGLSLDFGTSYLLPQRVGLHRAKEMALTANEFDAAAAAEIGFVNRVVPAGELDAAVGDYVERIVAGPPLALSMSKRLLDNAAHSSLAQSVEAEGLAQNVNFATGDVAEAGLAFVEKRAASFRGQ